MPKRGTPRSIAGIKEEKSNIARKGLTLSAPIFLRPLRHAMTFYHSKDFQMRKRHSWRIVPDDATHNTVEDLARRQSRPVANMALYLIELELEQVRASQRPADRSEPQQP